MELHYFPYSLAFKYPFKLSHTDRTHTDNVYLYLEDDATTAWGETVFIPYYSENLSSFIDLMAAVEMSEKLESIETIAAFIDTLKKDYPNNNFAIAGVDMALHNLLAKQEQTTIQSLYGIEGNPPPSSFTLGISDNATMIQKIEENMHVDYFKLKITESEVERIIACYLDNCDVPFVVDANQGFTSKENALIWAKEFQKHAVAYMEQPFDKHDLESHQWLKENSPIPIIADESFQTIEDLALIKDAFDGINVKLMKCGGINEAVKILRKAYDMDLKTVIGCMSESTVGIEAATQISPLADWADLDGHLLITNDLFAEEADLNDRERIEMLKRMESY